MGRFDVDPALRESFAHCRAVARREARNFYWGMRLTPEPKRSALYAVYAWMRAADDIGDAPLTRASDGEQPRDRSEQLDRFRAETHAALDPSASLPTGPLWPALRHVRSAFDLPFAPLWAMLDGQREDLEAARYDTFEDLYRYCVRVAGTVGEVCVHLWGHDDHPDVPRLVEQRGVALQLTNILRDLGEDARRGRCFLPAEDLIRFEVTANDFANGNAADLDQQRRMPALMRFEIERAEALFVESAPLEGHLVADCRRSSAVIAGVYRALLDRIAEDPLAVFNQRVRVPTWRKLTVVLAACRQHHDR